MSSGGRKQQQQAEKPAAAEDMEIKKVFSRFDTDGDGRISPSELAAVSRAIAPPATESAQGREVASMMDELDTDRDGYVDLGEFAAFHGRGRGERELDAELRDAFDIYDINGDGRISVAELSKVLSRIGEGCSTEDCEKMIASVDVDGDGCVGFDEFKKMMTGDVGARPEAEAEAGVPDSNKAKKE
ncbi:probable calcium-binding protein CML16 [Aegilops tauschii subsp. strangulata]|uniref:EF-hand domain-containing protein n=2 Tax=Triticinae TaxID=1648030 RepID=A0A453DTS9_AEGTS|nr:probable calcium-binding protein CML16 [Aegilops tauschii subsp. strangulata]